MASTIESDKAVIEGLGGVSALAKALGQSDEAVKKWTQRGIPWKARAQVHDLAVSRRVPVPTNFVHDRPAA